MDVAQTLRKLAVFSAAALLCAGAASAATLSVSPDTVTLGNCTGCVASFSVNSDGGATPYTATVTSTTQQFFSISGVSGTAPETVTLSRLSSCGGGIVTCPDGKITIHGGTGADVVVTVKDSTTSGGGGGGGGGTGGIYSASPNPINLSASNGFSTSTVVTLSSTSSVTDNITVTMNPAGSWLSVFPGGGQVSSGSSGFYQVTANSAALNPNQTYTGTVTFSGPNGTLDVPVNFTVGTGSVTGSLTANPNNVGMSYPCGVCVASVAVTSSTATSYTATSNANWLLVNNAYSTNGTTGGSNLALSLNTFAASQLSTGTYSTNVTLTPNTGTATTFAVTLSVNGATGGGTGSTATPTSLNFAYQIGKTAPNPQAIYVSGTDTYTITYSGRVVPYVNSITGPGTFFVQPTLQGVTTGNTSGSIVLTSNSSNVSQTIATNLLVSDTSPVINATVNNSLGNIVCASQNGCTFSVAINASDASSLPLTIAASNTWIVVSSAPSTTPGTFNVQLVPTGLSGLNNGTVTVSATGAANSLVIPVVFALSGTNTGGGGGTGPLTLNPSTVNFTSAGTQSVNVSLPSGGTSAYSAALGTTGCSWLSMTSTGFTPGTITLSAVNPGTSLTCNITLTANGQTQTLPVTFNGGSGGGGGTGTITATPTTLNFTTQVGVTPPTQTVHLTGSNNSSISYTASGTQISPWVTVTPASGTTPSDITVGVNPANLQPGSYLGYVQVSGTTGFIMVNLTVTAATTVSASPSALTFNYSAGGTVPSSQKVQVTGVAANLPFSATVTSGADWLSVTPTSGTAGTTATDLTVSVNPTTLAANKTYTGTIVVAGTGTATGSSTVTVTLNISAPLPTITRVTNAASFNSGSISAGEIITIFGTAIGPSNLQVAAPTNGLYPTELAGVQVTVGGYLAPLIYVRGDQVSAIVPYEINRPVFLANVAVVVRFLGQGSNGVNVQQTAAAPGIFTTGGGTGQAAALNQNLSVNSAGNAANKGEVIVLYVTGEGQTSPAGVSGKVTGTPIPTPVSGQVTVSIDGVPAQVQFAGEAPGLVSGVMQVNAVIPTGLTRSGDLPVVVSVGGAASQVDARGIGTATIAVR